MKIGFLKECEDEQVKNNESSALEEYGCEKIFDAKESKIASLINSVNAQDEIVVNNLSDLSMNYKEMKNFLNDLIYKDATITILAFPETVNIDNFNLRKKATVLMIRFIDYFSNNTEYKKRKPKYSDDSIYVQRLLKYATSDPNLSVKELCKLSGIKSRTTVYSILDRHSIKRGPSFDFTIGFGKKD